MASKILILDENLVKKIAAGEVIERPASCVKELIENSIDADAKNITCIFKRNGVPLIKVIDDGIGMSPEDLKLCILPHSTSKIKTEKDLERIATLGFRGEALSSIKDVSILEITSRERGSAQGYYIKVLNGEIVAEYEVNCPQGTQVSVKNLFYNVPVKLRFLKSDRTEIKAIINTFLNYAIAYPEINFKLIHDDREIYDLKSAKLKERLEDLFSRDYIDKMVAINYEKDYLNIYGFIARPDTALTPYHAFFFVNRRPCYDLQIRKIILEIYQKEKEIPFFIFVNLPYEQVDVNIHPRKYEIRFKEENFVYREIRNAIKNALGLKFIFFERKEEVDTIPENPRIYQLHNTYILVETEKGFWLIDQHAAHERILYEKYLKTKIPVQRLIFPMVVELSPYEYQIYEMYKNELIDVGFSLCEFGKNTVRIEAVPSVLSEFNEKIFKSILNELSNSIKGSERLNELAKVLACKSAIQAGDELTYEEMKHLIEELMRTESPLFCPHGRPTIWMISLKDLDKKFKRIE